MDLGEKAKKLLTEYVPLLDAKIASYLDSEISKGFGFNERQKQVVLQALEHTKEYILRPTKRLRGSFVNAGFLLSGKDVNDDVWQAAVGIELVHAALLMHDDFMDQDTERRRGVATHIYYKNLLVNNLHYGESMAVTVGDAVLCLGFELVNHPAAIKQLLRGIANTAYGQAYDVTLEAFRKWTEDDVIVLHRAKTAIYTYENPLFVGAHMAKLPKKAFDILHEYSMDGGVAFQLQDDILGVFGDPHKTGKSADSDLKQGKCTLLILKGLESTKHKSVIEKAWGNHEVTREQLDAAKKAIIESGSLEYSRKLAKKYAEKAAKTASNLRDLKLNTDSIDYIQGIAEYMVNREV